MTGLRTTKSCDKCTKGWKNFRHLTKEELEMVNLNRYEATFWPGEVMIKQGSPASNALFMATGIAKSYIEGINGKNLILDLEKPGNLILGPGAWVNSRHNYSVAAITSIQACFVSFDILKQMARSNSTFSESLLEDFCSRNLKSHNRMVSMTQKRMAGRLADVLLYLADEIFCRNDFDMILTRQELGEMTAMAKECVVRILREMEKAGAINADLSRLKIIDREKLISISQKG